MSRLLIALSVALLFSSAAVADSRVGSATPDSTINRHFGFYIRLDPGVGYLSSSVSQNGNEMSVSGAAGTFGVALGGALTENVILGVHIFDGVATNPTLQLNGATANTSNTTLTMLGIGPQLTVYLGESNTYFSATAGLTTLSVEANGTKSDAQNGFGGRIAFGKEWWMSDHWGLGLAAQASYSTNADNAGTNAPSWSTFVGSVVFSATYN